MTVSLGHEDLYFGDRHIWLDRRGTLLIDPTSEWGYFITVITQSHETAHWKEDGFQAQQVDRPVIVERNAWILSNSILYNCIIHEGAVVALGSVVRSQEVMPWTMVAGNPARIVARYADGKWNYVIGKFEVLE